MVIVTEAGHTYFFFQALALFGRSALRLSNCPITLHLFIFDFKTCRFYIILTFYKKDFIYNFVIYLYNLTGINL